MAPETKSRIVALALVIGAVWAVSLVALSYGDALIYRLALVPRRIDGLPGIVGMPFVHGSFGHLMSNTMSLLVFGAFLLFRGVRYYVMVSLGIVGLGGVLLWLFGREAAHIGASGVVFGYFGFLLTRGVYERSFQSVAVAGLVVLLYGGMIWGVLPGADGVSWDGHLAGLVAGIVVARVAFGMERRRRQPARDPGFG
ncbi:MAG: rhomboid family intramembrane serine protease [Pseudomonadales bacterium]|nr:rhomboid family intramembrane serine protease [Pseudomonadales bacterium]